MPSFRSILSLLLIIINVAFASNCVAQHIEENGDTSILMLGGNRVIMEPWAIKDTEYVIDPVYNKQTMALTTHYEAASINGEKIYAPDEVSTPPVSNIPGTPLDEYLVNKIIKSLHMESVQNGNMRIYMNRLIIDKSGHLVLYHLERISYVGADNIEHRSVPFYDDTLYNAMVNTPRFKPATLNGENVNSRLDLSLAVFDIRIQDHIATVTRQLN